ncbi:MAG: methionyl-tRNA formyltransferase [Clostridiales bacterium]|nr:methionyl-tRNA formyltransferase [Clostridiales bacterium]
MKVLFMGTPDFALESLKAIYEAGFDICGVYTQPDKPAKRGMKLTASPVKEYALKNGLPVFQPARLRNQPEVLEEMKSLGADIAVVVAYGKLIPEDMLECMPLGFINIHGSLLPKYRGSAPIQWTVLNGEELGGVTSMYLAPEMDAGDMIDMVSTPVGEYETYGELYDRLKVMGAELLVNTLRAIENGTAVRTPQNSALASFAPPLHREDCPIDWTKPARRVINHICGLAPKPAATAEFGGETFKIFAAVMAEDTTDLPAGRIVGQNKQGLVVACGDGKAIVITELQAPGGKRMKTADYLRGHKITD